MPGPGRPFVSGQVANPGGRVPYTAEMREAVRLLKEGSKQAAQKLVALLQCGDLKVEAKAAELILDRAFGKPHQSVSVSGEDGAELTAADQVVALEKLLAAKRAAIAANGNGKANGHSSGSNGNGQH